MFSWADKPASDVLPRSALPAYSAGEIARAEAQALQSPPSPTCGCTMHTTVEDDSHWDPLAYPRAARRMLNVMQTWGACGHKVCLLLFSAREAVTMAVWTTV